MTVETVKKNPQGLFFSLENGRGGYPPFFSWFLSMAGGYPVQGGYPTLPTARPPTEKIW